MPQRRTPVTALSVPIAVRDEVNTLALNMSAQIGRRVPMAAVVRAALAIAQEHPEELADRLREEEG